MLPTTPGHVTEKCPKEDALFLRRQLSEWRRPVSFLSESSEREPFQLLPMPTYPRVDEGSPVLCTHRLTTALRLLIHPKEVMRL